MRAPVQCKKNKLLSLLVHVTAELLLVPPQCLFQQVEISDHIHEGVIEGCRGNTHHIGFTKITLSAGGGGGGGGGEGMLSSYATVTSLQLLPMPMGVMCMHPIPHWGGESKDWMKSMGWGKGVRGEECTRGEG